MSTGNLVLMIDKGNEETVYFLGKMGYKLLGSNRKYSYELPGLSIFHGRDIDIPTNVLGKKNDSENQAYVGICSGPVWDERCDSKAKKLLDLPYGKSQFLIYSNSKISGITDVNGLKSKKISVKTSWPLTAAKYFNENGITHEITEWSGPDAIFRKGNIIGFEPIQKHELWKDHKLIDTQESSSGVLFANPISYEKYSNLVKGFAHRFQMAINSEGWRLLKFNIHGRDLKKIRKILPAMKSPSHNKLLHQRGWYSVETALPNGEIEEIITQLEEQTSAMGFIDTELNGVELNN